MPKFAKYLILFIVGIIILILELTILKFDDSLGLLVFFTGIIMSLIGLIGSCISSNKVRTYVINIFKILFDYF